MFIPESDSFGIGGDLPHPFIDDRLRGQENKTLAVEQEIARVRGLGSGGAGQAPCAPQIPITYPLNGYTIRVDCTNLRTTTITGFDQRNVVFTSCVDAGSACTTSNTIVRAQVNYAGQGSGTPTIDKTYIQSWTVSR